MEKAGRTGNPLDYLSANIGNYTALLILRPTALAGVVEAFCVVLLGVALWKWGVIQGERSALLPAADAGLLPPRVRAARDRRMAELLTVTPVPQPNWMSSSSPEILWFRVRASSPAHQPRSQVRPPGSGRWRRVQVRPGRTHVLRLFAQPADHRAVGAVRTVGTELMGAARIGGGNDGDGFSGRYSVQIVMQHQVRRFASGPMEWLPGGASAYLRIQLDAAQVARLCRRPKRARSCLTRRTKQMTARALSAPHASETADYHRPDKQAPVEGASTNYACQSRGTHYGASPSFSGI